MSADRWLRLGQKKLADYLYVHQTLICLYEHGKRWSRGFEVEEKMCSKLRITQAYLRDGDIAGVLDWDVALRLAAKHPELVKAL